MLTYPATYLLNICTGGLADILNWTHSRLNSWSFPHSQRLFHPSPPTSPTLPQLMSILLVSQTENPGFLSFQLGNSTGSAIKIYPEKKNIYIPRIWPLFLISTSSPLCEPSPITWIAALASLLVSLLLPRPLTFCAQHNPYNGLGHCDPYPQPPFPQPPFVCGKTSAKA